MIGSFLIVLGVTGFVWPLIGKENDDLRIGTIEIATAVAGMAIMFIGLILKSKNN